jgi:DNA-binding FadR family transcriptional regulator
MIVDLGVSRGTLREALRLLEAQGLIVMRNGRGGGPVVAAPNPGALASTLSINFRVLGVSFEEVLITRETIEPVLARDAALNRTDEDLDRLREIVARMRTRPGQAEMISCNREFHTAIAMASRNRPLAILWSAIETIADGQGIGADAWDERLWTLGQRAHTRIVSAIERSDAAAAEEAMRRHVSGFRREVTTARPSLLHVPVKVPMEKKGPTSVRR